jgi:LuxR family transcriptional regulator, maltose regulon positive regulatory protein
VADVKSSLLTTKLFIPPGRPGLVARPRLSERLGRTLNCGLALVSAPAGFGKTTLVSEWVHSNQLQIFTAWLSLEETENDPIRFWDYFIAALKTLKPTAGKTALSLLHSPQPYPTESILTALINDLTGIRRDFVIVLDDYHLIKTDAIHKGITFLLDHLPSKMHLVIATRVDPPLLLAHLRGKGALLEIRVDDLRFTLEETATFLKDIQNLEMTPEEINTLNVRTEGWVVGLTMAALSMHGEKDMPGFVAGFTGSQRYVVDYLIEEVLKKQSDEVRDFLLKTSVLERLTGPLCDTLTGRDNGREIILKLENENLFITPLDMIREWYRYHQLFAELLRHQLGVTWGEEVVTALHLKASLWYEDHGFSDDAIHHALAARDWESAMRLIYAQSQVRMQRGEWNTLLNWLRLIPDDSLRTNLRVYGRYARILVTVGNTDAGVAILSHLERSIQVDTVVQGEVALTRMIMARRMGNIPGVQEMAEKALAFLPRDSLSMRAWASWHLGFIQYEKGLLEGARLLFKEAYEMGRQAGEDWVLAWAVAYLGVVLFEQGRLRDAVETVQRAVDLAMRGPGTALARSVLADFLYERNDLEGVLRNAHMAVEFYKFGGQAGVLLDTRFWLARTRLAQGDVAGAEVEMEKMDQAAMLPTIDLTYRAYHVVWHILFAIRQNDIVSAKYWGIRLQEYTDVLPFDVCHVPARLLIAQGDKTAAAEQLQTVHDRAARAGAHGLVIWIRIYQALAADTPTESLSFLAEALSLAQPEGFVRFFVDEGRLLTSVLRQALAKGITPEYTGELLNIIESEERQRKIRQEKVPTSMSTSGLLSERELEVLQLVAGGLSNGQIAHTLFVTPGTIKRHIYNLAEKLGARNRTQAVTRARELKLL